ncbi:type II toxin-antitoxin system HicB family antitoxin [Candidatus Uhrbacteria bacterium]|nr:type II toxin-antitoxin system HicB family antitoxin [Candidatus Uhrbacteria bacterium]
MENERIYNFTVVFHPAEEGGYMVIVPALPGCITEGDTLDDAKKMAEEAIQLYCESLLADGESIPEDRGEFIGQVKIKAGQA